jgi:hypothetical protein
MNLYKNTEYYFVYIYNNGDVCVPVYSGDKNATNPNPGTFAIIIRFKVDINCHLMGYIDVGKCIRINMYKNQYGQEHTEFHGTHKL